MMTTTRRRDKTVRRSRHRVRHLSLHPVPKRAPMAGIRVSARVSVCACVSCGGGNAAVQDTLSENQAMTVRYGAARTSGTFDSATLYA